MGNQATTDPYNPPKFRKLEEVPFPPQLIKSSLEKDPRPRKFPDRTVSDVYAEVLRVIRNEPSWEIVNEIPEEGVVEFVATTKLMKYKDDVVVVVSNDPDGGAVVNVRSKSRKGDEDFGTNRRRIKYLLDQLYRNPDPALKEKSKNSASQQQVQTSQQPTQPIETNPTVLKLLDTQKNVKK